MEKSKKSYIRKVLKISGKSKGNLIGYLIVSIAEGALNIIIPLVSAKAIIYLTGELFNQLLLAGFTIFFLNVIASMSNYFKGFFYQRIYRSTMTNVQSILAKETLKLRISEFDKNGTGLFINRLNNDPREISSIFMEYTFWTSAIISRIGILISIFIISKWMFLYTVISLIVLYIVTNKRITKEASINKELKTLNEERTSIISEIIRGVKDIKVLNAKATIKNEMRRRVVAIANKNKDLNKVKVIYTFLYYCIMDIYNFLFIIVGVILYSASLLTAPNFVILYHFKGRVADLLEAFVRLKEYNKQFDIAAERIFDVIEGKGFKKEKFGKLNKDNVVGDIEFKDVHFKYKRKVILDGVSFKIKHNEKVAFVGASGAGKSTILNLLAGFYKPFKGEILIDNENINKYSKNTLRGNMSMITQTPYIFNFTIKDNLLLAKEDASKKEIKSAASLAYIDEFIDSLDEKYDTRVGENGLILSGGQKQRVAIARALLVNSKIILFDEATSALDNESQSKISEAVDKIKGKSTILIVAHRLSTIINCDKIFVLDGGKIIDSGSHKELIKRCKFYKELYNKDLKR